MRKIIFFFSIALLLMGCEQPQPPQTAAADQSYLNGSVHKFIDQEAGVVCWVYGNVNQGGISCLPISQTKLGEKK